MSIIAEALRKAKEQRDRTISSEEYMNKVLGPERKETYTKTPVSEIKDAGRLSGKTNKALILSGALLLVAMVLLVITNVFLAPSFDVSVATSDVADVPLEAEAYTDVKSEVALIDNDSRLMDRVAIAFRGVSVKDEFLSTFTLNGVVHAADGSWALINNKVAKVGDTLDGATVISITPNKVEVLFRDEKFDLVLK